MIEEFLDHLNSTIQFTVEVLSGDRTLPFLDVCLWHKEDGNTETSEYGSGSSEASLLLFSKTPSGHRTSHFSQVIHYTCPISVSGRLRVVVYKNYNVY